MFFRYVYLSAKPQQTEQPAHQNRRSTATHAIFTWQPDITIFPTQWLTINVVSLKCSLIYCVLILMIMVFKLLCFCCCNIVHMFDASDVVSLWFGMHIWIRLFECWRFWCRCVWSVNATFGLRTQMHFCS